MQLERRTSAKSFSLGMAIFGFVVACAAGAPAEPLSSPATRVTRTRDLHVRGVVAAFEEELALEGEAPSAAVADRMVDLASKSPDDPELLYWASRAIMKGWTSTRRTDGVDLLRKAARLGHAGASLDLGWYLCTGLRGIIDPDSREGWPLLRDAAAKGDPRALFLKGVRQFDGCPGVPADPEEAEKCLRQAVAGGWHAALYPLGQLEITRGKKEAAEKHIEQAAALGDVLAMRHLVDANRTDYAARNPEKAVKLLERGVLWREPAMIRMYAAKATLGLDGVKGDPALAMALMLQAEELGDIPARVLLALMRLKVRGQEERGFRALKWLAEKEPSGFAAFALGEAYVTGARSEENIREGLRLIREAATLDFPPAKQWITRHDPAKGDPQRSPAGAPSTQAIEEQLRANLRVLFDFASSRVDLRAKRNVPAARVPQMPEADQERDDNDRLSDAWRLQLCMPSWPTIHRVVDRARRKDASAATKTWAAITFRTCPQGYPATGEEAARWLKEAAESGESPAMAQYGSALVEGKPYPQDIAKGMEWLETAHAIGEPMATAALGIAYLQGVTGIRKDPGRAVALLEDAAAKEHLRCYAILALAHISQDNPEKALEALQRGVARANAESCALAAFVVTDQTRMQLSAATPASRQALLWRGAMGGWLGPATEYALTLEDDAVLARRLLAISARAGDPKARAIRAAALITGELGFPTDPDRGLAELEAMIKAPPERGDFFRETADRMGRAEAAWRLGELLYAGKQLPHDSVRGRALIEQAAREKNRSAVKWISATR